MKSLFYLAVILCAVALQTTARAQQNSVSVIGNSRSIYFGPMVRFDQTLGQVTTFLTTYDGRTDIAPLGFSLNPIRFSGEAKVQVLDPRIYEADYMIHSTAIGWREYGSFTVEFPTTDLDSDGVPDVVQRNKAVNFISTGNLRIDWPFPTIDSFTLGMTRGSNQLSGDYSLYRNSEAAVSVGTIRLFNIAGGATYTRSTAFINFTFEITDPLASTRTVSGSATYTVPNQNQIVLPQFSVTTNGGPTYTFQSGFTLTRSGTRYIGNARLTDGIPETPWADSTNWVIEITDTNDWDSNGIPDISDAIPSPPFFLAQPQSRTAVLGSNATFSVTASGSMPLQYQWQFNGTNMAGRTLSSMTISNVQFANAGNYRCLVWNGGGTATSEVATLTVIFAPSITDQPMDQTVLGGQSAQFNVGSIGTEPLYYQWRRESTNLPGENNPILSIVNAQPSHEGLYSVVVSNAAGSVLSSSARLTVVVPPSISMHPQSFSAPIGGTVVFSVDATGHPTPTYRWMRNGTNVPGGTAATLTLSGVQPASEGVFNVRVSNVGGNELSSNATLYVGWPLTLTNFFLVPGGNIQVDLIGPPNANYALERSVNVSNWVSIATNPAPRGILRLTDPAGGAPRFYRGRVN